VPYLYNPSKKLLISPDIHNGTIVQEVCTTLNSDECQRWQSCCFSAHDCCERQLASPLGDLNKTCGRTWDGWGCWDDTKPGQQVYMSCPLYLTYSMPSRK
jgi:calcitonin receptor-like